ncbi:MAG: primosomal protein N' [Alphaproteobacteria bacterium]|nr:primosomal protein N' [Alphaproteobacteria bacterium]
MAENIGDPQHIVGVLLPLPLGTTYDYRVPDGLGVVAGDFVEVPLGSRRVAGVVWGPSSGGAVAANRLKAIIRRLDAPAMPEAMRRFVDWVARYTLNPPGLVLRMAMGVKGALEAPKPRIAYRAVPDVGSEAGPRLTPARRRVLAVLADGRMLPASELALAAGVGAGVVHGLIEVGLLAAESLPEAGAAWPDGAGAGPALSPAQATAAKALRAAVTAATWSATLLDGVTGAGKTEVYFEAVAEALAQRRQVLVLLPEIALTAQWLDRFTRRFAAAPAVWHSDLGAAERRATWRAVAAGRTPVVVGARSALFLPFPDLGLIVVDEEHEAAYKQEDGVTYHARDMAVVRARLADIPVALVSATPALETLANVARGRYGVQHLPDRHGGARLPEIALIDMRLEPPESGRFLSPRLVAALQAALVEGEQAMLFLNRRGYAPLTLCRHCGHRLCCPNCTAWLVEHRYLARLQCHHCGYSIALPPACPACAAEASLTACGPGVERIAEEVAALAPEARVAIVTSDTVTGPRAASELIRRIEAREIDVLIGTQMLAKGHHFPLLTLVGVVDADLGLGGGDLRAGERTFQLLSQVAGRAGRADRPGRVFLQTWEPEHPVMRALAANDRAGFLAAEGEGRREAGMPPYGRLAALILSSPDAGAAEAAARALARRAPHGAGVRVLGPAPAPLAVLRGAHRWRLLLKAERDIDIQATLRDWLAAVPPQRRVRLQVDIDPMSFL